MLKLENITKKYSTITALNDVNFEIKKGEVVGFLGVNGAGKTTTFKVLAGILNPSSGDVIWEDKKVDTSSSEYKMNIGYLPEENPLYRNLKVDEAINYVAKLKSTKIDDEIKELIRVIGLSDKLTTKISSLSKGYKQRVGILLSLIGNPELIILDEPTTGLDPNQKEEVLKLIKKIGEKRTIIFSSHILSEVEKIADRIIIINNGNIIAEGKIDKLMADFYKTSYIEIELKSPKSKHKDIVEKLKIEKFITEIEHLAIDDLLKIELQITKESEEEVFNHFVRNKLSLRKMAPKEQMFENLFKQLIRKD